MRYRTINSDVLEQKETSNFTLNEIMLQDAFLTNYKIALGIVEEVLPNEEDNKQTFIKCRVAIQKQLGLTERGVPICSDYAPIYARLMQWGNNEQPITTKVKVNQLCLLFFTDRPFDNAWTQQPNEETGLIATQPLSTYRAHDMGDAICIPFSHDVSLTDITTIRDDIAIEGNVYQVGNLSISGNLYVSGNITAAHIEAEDGFTGTKIANENIQFNKGICIG